MAFANHLREASIARAFRTLLNERNCIPLPAAGTKSDPTINLVVGVREPIANVVSYIFQLIADSSRWAEFGDEKWRQFLQNPHETLPLQTRAVGQPWPLVQQAWWKEHMENVFGLDFLALDFDKERGWHIYDFGSVRFLVIRLESFSRLPQALSQFYDMPLEFVRSRIATVNVGAEKGSGVRYQEFRSRVKLPTEVLDLAYGSRFASHFYTSEELASFRNRWAEK
jgi:hypothetical protein